ncbi:phenylalanine--tRNA ligase subunit alpha [candidate division WOR-1 bacterium RIFOXYD2_FULL_36_8]|uniref:Phenylalanine--tRNA ligase alpha subunit n=1 Tax=candidate division WOR-1 bacterium RIFOXYB2_FULL_36_35 TaxID=1802578 RepID=A0A1F4S9B9_UNCSA|nr:MAG: phenylalanine--tRNA ligase subunit alpha [candidate division WOR-1 bacterium RIFOXYA2_FULL_36_21]OGC16087.1 MAG: phenylalanine--tRNA ligase subunit alpha [candidate division WOR-1 bacterium RIFOXYA12_FULL_36_13]OGC16333.1 MAG: phenylalanine--tRNA ligase subunit alpha [candidate division WOR-1 bacterium RIFOXYB2_FULL_36_35]OGC39092.1 MAG: phenylalanine--tRNA ligase subunit alpha [candidate division WOR-1 bacterium RIFOXYD2_FULL_36_8]
MLSGKIEEIKLQADSDLDSVKSLQDLESIRIKYLGKKGLLTEILKSLKTVDPSDRPAFGQSLNLTKREIETKIEEKKVQFEGQILAHNLSEKTMDITLPGKRIPRGKRHPITVVVDELVKIFRRLGFDIALGPDIETEYYNFEALNIPKYHPSRDMWATFWLENGLLLRTHTSPVQIRIMEKQKPPFAFVVPGRVYRRDDDITHSSVFHQLEGLMVDTNITFGDLKGVLTAFLHAVFGKNKKVRFRPSYFPFTEPSAEVDVECTSCGGKGCRICKETGWIEILGSGMVDPNVFGYVDIDPEKYSGFAFGLGIERIAMLKHGIDDIRLFYENDLRFLKQF